LDSLEPLKDAPLCKGCLDYLADLSGRTGENPGSNGGLSTWGVIADTIDGEWFVECLRSFWAELLALNLPGGPSHFDKIIVVYEQELAGAAESLEIGYDDEAREHINSLFMDANIREDPDFVNKLPFLKIVHYLLPFSWFWMWHPD
jgi:hypothetical protein